MFDLGLLLFEERVGPLYSNGSNKHLLHRYLERCQNTITKMREKATIIWKKH